MIKRERTQPIYAGLKGGAGGREPRNADGFRKRKRQAPRPSFKVCGEECSPRAPLH